MRHLPHCTLALMLLATVACSPEPTDESPNTLNSMELGLRDKPRSATPDLVVSDITWSTPATAGSTVTFSARIKNQGSGATPAGAIHGVAFRVDGTLVSWSDTSTSCWRPV